jgi:hypothetical protein
LRMIPSYFPILSQMNPVDTHFHSFHSSLALQRFVGPWPLLQFRNLFYTVGMTPWTGDQPIARPLPTHRTTQSQNKRTQTSMHCMEFEPKIRASERAKIVHALDRASTVIGPVDTTPSYFSKIHFILYSNLGLGLPSGLFPSGFLTKI